MRKPHKLEKIGASERSASTAIALKQCKCRNSRCLKLYCECFRARVFCNNCNCVDCHNTEEHMAEVQGAEEHALQRNPNAFEPKIETDV